MEVAKIQRTPFHNRPTWDLLFNISFYVLDGEWGVGPKKVSLRVLIKCKNENEKEAALFNLSAFAAMSISQ